MKYERDLQGVAHINDKKIIECTEDELLEILDIKIISIASWDGAIKELLKRLVKGYKVHKFTSDK
jgi:hypothetical protein